MTNQTFTNNEVIVYNAIIDQSISDDAAYIDDLASDCSMTVATIKGVIGSLTKKGMVTSEIEDRDGYLYNPIHAIIDADKFERSIVSYGCDWFTDEQIEEMKLKSDADAHVEEVLKGEQA